VLGNASVTLLDYDMTEKRWSLAGPVGDTGYIIKAPTMPGTSAAPAPDKRQPPSVH
jgi:hypothetical protein